MSTELDSVTRAPDSPASPAKPRAKQPKVLEYLQTLGKDASRLIFEDELTGIRQAIADGEASSGSSMASPRAWKACSISSRRLASLTTP